MDQSTLHVQRLETPDWAIKYTVWLDNKPIGHLGHKEQKTILISSGKHSLKIYTWAERSEEITFTIGPNEEVYFNISKRSETAQFNQLGLALAISAIGSSIIRIFDIDVIVVFIGFCVFLVAFFLTYRVRRKYKEPMIILYPKSEDCLT